MQDRFISSIAVGIIGSTLTALMAITFVWLFSFGWTFVEYLLSMLLFMPAPLVVGGIAGISVPYILKSTSTFRVTITAVLGMIGGIIGGVYLFDPVPSSQEYSPWYLTYLGIIGVGVTIEIAMIAFMALFKCFNPKK